MNISVHGKILTRIGMFWQILLKFDSTKFFENLLSNFWVITWGYTGKWQVRRQLWQNMVIYESYCCECVRKGFLRFSDPVHVLVTDLHDILFACILSAVHVIHNFWLDVVTSDAYSSGHFLSEMPHKLTAYFQHLWIY